MAETKKSIYEKVLEIQASINVPKSQYNKFGNFYYRNTDDILNAIKPFLKNLNLSLFLSDELVEIGSRFYIKSVAKVVDNATKEEITTTAYAREPENKKGMDEMQITGATSSYARKYALNGLFAIDDNKDADYYSPQATQTSAKTQKQQQYQRQQQQPKQAQQRAPQTQQNNNWQELKQYSQQNINNCMNDLKMIYDNIKQLLPVKNMTCQHLNEILLNQYKVKQFSELTLDQARQLYTFIASK